MLILLAIPVVVAVAFAFRVLQAVAPSNLLIARVRSARPMARCAAGLGALALTLIGIGRVLALAIENGAPGWLYLVSIVLLWDAVKLLLVAISVLLRALATSVRRVGRALVLPRRRAWS
jgi:hypothetical protein